MLKVLCIGAGNMGRSHALAYRDLDEYEVCGVVTRTAKSREAMIADLNLSCDGFSDLAQAIEATSPDVVSISSYPDTHAEYARLALEAGAHVFCEKPLADTVEGAEEIVDLAKKHQRKVVVGYILRQHPSWQKFIDIARELGTPLVMRMNLNQQSSGATWETHRNLMSSVSPIVDCGVHYVDVMCQMTRSKPVRVSAIGARLSDELPKGKMNYGQLQVTFENGSVGWYEAGWGPMMSEEAFFVKDVVGPRGSVTIKAKAASAEGESDSVAAHTQTESLLRHSSELVNGKFANADEWMDLSDEPDHDELCKREQQYLLDAILEDRDLSDHLADAVTSMKIVAAAQHSIDTGETVRL